MQKIVTSSFDQNLRLFQEILRVDDIITDVLSGVPIMLIDGYDKIIEIDCRTYPARGVDEPEKDKTLRGSKDGFVETIVFNTALIRRRIRSPQLTSSNYRFLS